MSNGKNEFIMSLEQECLTSVPERPETLEETIERFMSVLAARAPSLRGPHGIFNGYGRVYVDCGHIEMAACECSSPYLLASVIERQEMLVTEAVEQMAQEGFNLLLASNNHSGLLESECPIWGSHENHMTEEHPSKFADRILPFLVSRVYAGSGGVHYPGGSFLAAVRPIRMETAVGGGTTEYRAIHSTAREEHHMGPRPKRFRYHQILGDGHRSHYNLALQFGATALALKAVFYDAKLLADLKKLRWLPFRGSWLETLRRFNILARPGQSPKVNPMVVEVQRVYLDAAYRYADSLDERPEWIPRLLRDWEETLTAMEKSDRAWLAARLDAFAKYEFYSAVLKQSHHTWPDLLRFDHLFHELALLDHSYHAFACPRSVFRRLDEAGALSHRVCPPISPGGEPEPYVPEPNTRAAARARLIRENAGRRQFLVDWSWVRDCETGRFQTLLDPFAETYEDGEPFDQDPHISFTEWAREIAGIRGRRQIPF